MKNFIQSGKTITLTAPYTVTSGAGALVGNLFGVAVDDVTNGASGEFMTEGVFDLAKDASVFAAGSRVYWDNTNKQVTITAAGNKLIGRAIQAALTGASTGRVLLCEAVAPQFFVSAEQTGTGSAQNVAHGLGVIPTAVLICPTDLTPATTGAFTVTEGTHTSTNIVVTVTTSKKFKAVGIVY